MNKNSWKFWPFLIPISIDRKHLAKALYREPIGFRFKTTMSPHQILGLNLFMRFPVTLG